MRAATTNTNTAASRKPVATQQSLVTKTGEDISVKYKDTKGNAVELTLPILNNYLSLGENFTAADAWGYFQLCKARKLNPLERDCYLVKYGDKPTIVVTRDCYSKRANAHPDYDGKESGVIVLTEDGLLENRDGTIVLEDEELIGAWCKVYLKNRKYPEYITVNFKEVCRYRTDKNGNTVPQSTWATQPAWMCVKVAESRALKAAIPEVFGGTYGAEEVGYDEPDVTTPIVSAPSSKAKSDPFPDAKETDFTPVDADTGEISDDAMENLFGEDM